jgi:hypothetical protein
MILAGARWGQDVPNDFLFVFSFTPGDYIRARNVHRLQVPLDRVGYY